MEITKNTFYLNLHFKNIFLCTESFSVSHHWITKSHWCEKTHYLQKCSQTLEFRTWWEQYINSYAFIEILLHKTGFHNALLFIKGNATASLIQIYHINPHRIWERDFDSIFSEVNLLKMNYALHIPSSVYIFTHICCGTLKYKLKKTIWHMTEYISNITDDFCLLTFCDHKTKWGFA